MAPCTFKTGNLSFDNENRDCNCKCRATPATKQICRCITSSCECHCRYRANPATNRPTEASPFTMNDSQAFDQFMCSSCTNIPNESAIAPSTSIWNSSLSSDDTKDLKPTRDRPPKDMRRTRIKNIDGTSSLQPRCSI